MNRTKSVNPRYKLEFYSSNFTDYQTRFLVPTDQHEIDIIENPDLFLSHKIPPSNSLNNPDELGPLFKRKRNIWQSEDGPCHAELSQSSVESNWIWLAEQPFHQG